MGKVSFTAINHKGERESGYIDAKSNNEAIDQLKEKGFSEIHLHADALISDRPDLEDLSEEMLKQMAAFEAESQKDPSFLKEFLHLLKLYKIVFFIASAMILYGIYNDNVWSWGIGAFIIAFIVGSWLYGYKESMTFEKIHRLKAFGEKEEALALIEKTLQNPKTMPQMRMQLISYKAQFLSCKGALEEALQLIESYKEEMDALSPLMYATALSGTYYQAGKYDEMIKTMEGIHEQERQTLTAFDHAFAHARFGDAKKAQEIIDNEVSPEEIADYAKGMYAWCQGLIHHRMGNMEQALSHYERMLHFYNEYKSNPLMWEMFALALGYYAYALSDAGEEKKAQKLLQEGTVHILEHNADDILRKHLTDAFGNLIDTQPHCVRS